MANFTPGLFAGGSTVATYLHNHVQPFLAVATLLFCFIRYVGSSFHIVSQCFPQQNHSFPIPYSFPQNV